jgi:hypothetical protein
MSIDTLQADLQTALNQLQAEKDKTTQVQADLQTALNQLQAEKDKTTQVQADLQTEKDKTTQVQVDLQTALNQLQAEKDKTTQVQVNLLAERSKFAQLQTAIQTERFKSAQLQTVIKANLNQQMGVLAATKRLTVSPQDRTFTDFKIKLIDSPPAVAVALIDYDPPIVYHPPARRNAITQDTYNNHDMIHSTVFTAQDVSVDLHDNIQKLDKTLQQITLVMYLWIMLSALLLGIINIIPVSSYPNGLSDKDTIIGALTLFSSAVVAFLKKLHDHYRNRQINIENEQIRLHEIFVDQTGVMKPLRPNRN